MHPIRSNLTRRHTHHAPHSTTEPAWVRRMLIAGALLFLALFLFMPLAAVFYEALRKGVGAYWTAIKDDDAWSAIQLTLLAAGIAVPLNLVFGVDGRLVYREI